MYYQRTSPPIDINNVIQQLYRSTQFQAKLENKLNCLLGDRSKISSTSQSIPIQNKTSDKLIEQISAVIDTLIRTNLQTMIQNEFRSFKDDIWKLKQQLKNQSLSIDYLKRKVEKERQKDKQPLSFGQQRTQVQGETRNRFQITRKPAQLTVLSGGGSTTYTTSVTSPTYTQTNHQKQEHSTLNNDMNKLKDEIQSIRKQISSKQLSKDLIDISNKIEKNNDRIKIQLDTIVKNSDTRFQYTEQSIKKHMQRSLESLWKMITSIKNQLQDINSELHLNQSGIMMS